MIVREKLVINIDELGNKLPKLTSIFRYTNPEFIAKKNMKVTTAGVPDILYHYKIEASPDGDKLILPRGGLNKVINFYKENKIPFRILDERVSYDTPIDFKLRSHSLSSKEPIELMAHQIEIADSLEKSGGLIQASPGSGKSISMLGLIERIKQPTLVLVHEHRLRKQWENEFKDKTEGSYKLGRLDGEKKVDGDVVLGLLQSAHKLMQENPGWFDQFGMVITDECHKLGADTYNNVVTNIPAKYRIGITGTIKRSDGLHLLIYDVIGPVLLEIKEYEVKSRITDFEFEMIDTNIEFKLPTRYHYSNGKKNIVLDPTKTLNLLAESIKRNNIIVSEVIKDIEEGYFPLVLSARVEHCRFIYNKLKEKSYNCVLLIGATRKKYNWVDIQKDESIDCIVGIDKIASEGLDLPRLSAAHFTCPTTNQSQLQQRLGRIRRTFPNKKLPRLKDYVDNLAFFKEKDKNGKEIKKYALKNKGFGRLKFYKNLQKEYRKN